jgi:uncharacterized iron-regulated protein
VIEASTGSPVSFQDVVARAAMADVVFFGEQHDDPETHFAEFALLEGIGRQRRSLILSLEMFERDVQPLLDDYLAGRMSEAEFLAGSRPWDRYATDYRGLVMLARARGWKVIAANVPRPIASAVSRRGLSALDTLSTASRAWAAASFSCPNDAYYARFAQAMSGHSAGGGPPTANDAAAMVAMTQRFYEAQCVKDETMAESIVRALRATQYPSSSVPEVDGLVVHFNGAFHSDYGQGTAQRVSRRVPGVRRLIITAVPVADPWMASMGDHTGRADYVIFTRAAAKKPGG